MDQKKKKSQHYCDIQTRVSQYDTFDDDDDD